MELSFSHFNYKDNLPQQRELFKDCFPETNGEVIQENRHYNWKFHSFPADIKSWEYAAYIGEDMVGYYAALPYQYKIGETHTAVGMVCDVMTSSAYRGKGIFTKLGKYSLNELSAHVPFTMGYPIRKEVIPGHLKVGWKIPFSLPLYMKFLKLDAFLQSKQMGFLAPFANIFLNLYNGICITKCSKDCYCKLYDSVDVIVGYNEFVNDWSKTVRNVLIKDLSFAKWRYGAPERKYKFLTVYNLEDKIIGLVTVRKIMKEGVPSLGIIDYMVLPGFEYCHGRINKSLKTYAKENNIEAIMTMMSKVSSKKYQLIKNGFLKTPYVFELIINNLTNKFIENELFNENNWHLMWIDSDDL